MKDLLSRDLLGPIVRIPDSQLNPAKWMHERVVKSIDSFEKKLDQEHEVGACLASFGSQVTFHIEDVGYWGPDMIVFHGVDKSGQKVQLLQHLTQLNVLLIAVRKIHEKPRRIGFELLKSAQPPAEASVEEPEEG